VNNRGIDYYNRVINELLANGVTPFITLHQWDLPIPLVNEGSWLNDSIVEHFGDFARVAFESFGDRVPYWVTLHEPLILCQADPTFGKHGAIEEPPQTPYKCVHNVIKAHTRAYRIYKVCEIFQTFLIVDMLSRGIVLTRKLTLKQDELKLTGQVGLTLNSEWAEPKDPLSSRDVEAANRLLAFRLGWFLDPFFKQEYPTVMRELVDSKSQNEGRNESRLPTFDEEWKQQINGILFSERIWN